MKTKTDIASVARKLFHHKNNVRGIKLMHPNRDWFFGVVSAIVIITAMVGWSVFTYYDQREKINSSGENVVAEVPSYKAELVDQALKLAEERAELFASFTAQNVGTTPEAIDELEVAPSASSTATSSAVVDLDDVIADTAASSSQEEIEGE